MSDREKAHRVIGIRSALLKFKRAGLVEEDALFPEEALEDIEQLLLKRVQLWYRIGARRGARQVLDALLQGKISLEPTEDGAFELITNEKSLRWRCRLRVAVGNRHVVIPSRSYTLKVGDLGFID